MPSVDESERKFRERLTAILRATPPLMRVLSVARHLCLPDWFIFSGAVYQPVLNHLTGRPLDYGIKDYDLPYFDESNLSYEAEDGVICRVKAAFDEPLRSMVEVRNQARVHLWFEAKFGEPYGPLSCTAEALERFASATFAVGVRLEPDDRLHKPRDWSFARCVGSIRIWDADARPQGFGRWRLGRGRAPRVPARRGGRRHRMGSFVMANPA